MCVKKNYRISLGNEHKSLWYILKYMADYKVLHTKPMFCIHSCPICVVPPPRRTYVCTIKLIKLKDNSVMLHTGNHMKLRKPISLRVRVSIITGERLQN